MAAYSAQCMQANTSRMCCVQGLSEAAGAQVRISFTPTLMPMSRGMQSTCYVRLANGASVSDLHEHLQVLVTPHPRPLNQFAMQACALHPAVGILLILLSALTCNCIRMSPWVSVEGWLAGQECLTAVCETRRNGTKATPLCTSFHKAASHTLSMCAVPTTTSSPSSLIASLAARL